MEFSEIISILDSNTVNVLKRRIDGGRYNGTMVVRSATRIAPDDDDVMLFAPASVFNAFADDFIESKGFVLWRNEPIKPVHADADIAVVKDEGDWLDAYELSSAEFRALQRKKEQVLMLTSLVNRGTTLKQLVNEAAAIIEAPASILDNSLSFLAYSDDFPHYAAFGEEETTGMVPDDALALLKRKGIVNPSKPIDLEVFDWTNAEGDVLTNHFSFIHSRDTIVGSVSFFTKNEHLRQSRVEMIPTIAQIISIQMQKSNTFLLNKSLYYANLFKRLEEGTLSQSPEYLVRRFSLFGYRLKSYLHIFVVDFSRTYLPSEQVQPLAERLHPLISNSIYTVNQSDIVFLSSNDDIHEEGLCNAEAIERELEGTRVVVGISSIYLEPKRTPSYIKEAKRAVSTGMRIDPNACIFPFSRYRLADMVAGVMDRDTLYSYRFPPLMHVIDLDAQNDTHLAYTLYEYLQDPSHPAEVAKRLFIHKNTLYYRLDRVRAIMGCDFKDAETVACIQMTFHVFRIQNRFEKLVLREDVSEHDISPMLDRPVGGK